MRRHALVPPANRRPGFARRGQGGSETRPYGQTFVGMFGDLPDKRRGISALAIDRHGTQYPARHHRRGERRLRIAIVCIVLCLGFAPPPAGAQTPPAFEPFHIAFHPKSDFTGKGQRLLLALGERELRVVDLADEAKPAIHAAIDIEAAAASFLPDGERVVTAGKDGALRFWSLDGKEAAAPVRASDKPLAALAVSQSGRFIVAADEALRVRLWRADGKPALAPGAALAMARQKVDFACSRSAVAISPDDKLVAAISCANIVYLWTAAGEPLPLAGGKFEYEACCPVAVGFARGGRHLVAVRAFQPGFGGYVASIAQARPGMLRDFPGTATLRHFVPLAGYSDSPPELLIVDLVGLRVVRLDGTPQGPSLVAPDIANSIRAIAVSADEQTIATIEDGAIVLRGIDGKPRGVPVK